ncbi:PIG-X [Mycena polygramma]|nr:PIG-X [Mycena polygramma]
MQSSSLLHPHSFHPVFRTAISAPGYTNCSLHLHYVLPAIVFVDPYELNDRVEAYTFQYAGPSNLELPVFALPAAEHDPELLITVAQPLPAEGVLEVEVPLHVRYGATAKTGGKAPFEHTQLPWPSAFLVCPSPSASSPSQSPSARLPPSFAASFNDAPSTSIVRLSPPPGALPFEMIRTPVGSAADVRRVEIGTAVVVFAAFVYLVCATRRTVARMAGRRVKEE